MDAPLAPLIPATPIDTRSAMNDIELRAQLERTHADAFHWAVACCRGDRDAAEETMQNAYLIVLDGRARYGERSSFRSWWFGVIRRTAASHRRSTWMRALLLERKADRVPVPQPSLADADTERASRNQQLRTAMGSLSARQQQVLQLVFYHDLTVEDAAAVMGISVGSARTHYARAKDRMAALLGPEEL